MPALTVPRPDVTAEEIGEALRQELGPRYIVLPGKGMNWNPAGGPRPDEPSKIVVGIGSARLFRAEVTMTRRSGHTSLHVIAGGISLPLRLANQLWIAQKVRHALRAAPSMR